MSFHVSNPKPKLSYSCMASVYLIPFLNLTFAAMTSEFSYLIEPNSSDFAKPCLANTSRLVSLLRMGQI